MLKVASVFWCHFFSQSGLLGDSVRITFFLFVCVFIPCSPPRFKMFTQSLNSNYRAPLSTAKERSVPPSLPQTQCRICTIYLNIFQVTESNLPILLFILQSFGLMTISVVNQIQGKIEKGDKSKYNPKKYFNNTSSNNLGKHSNDSKCMLRQVIW